MTLRSVIKQSLTQIMLRSTDEFAEEITYRPDGRTPGFVCRVVAADPVPQIFEDGGEIRERRTLQVVASLSQIKDGITSSVAEVRSPRRGDQVVFDENSDHAGTWSVVSVSFDGYDGCDLDLKYEKIRAAGGAGTQKVD